ncbi:MAG: radical SAM protein [Pseudomonadota bacterium]
MTFIIKLLYQCNLNCSYCYEKNTISKKTKLNLEQAKHIIKVTADFYHYKNPNEKLNYAWYGGEPMLKPLDFYKEIVAFQKNLFKNNENWSNGLQTNLVTLSENWISFLADPENKFSIGVSYDFCDKNRSFENGKNSDEIVLDNIEKLYNAGVDVTLLTTVNKNNIEKTDEILKFLHQNDISLRFTQLFYPHGDTTQVNRIKEVRESDENYIKFLSKIIVTWWKDDKTNSIVDNGYFSGNKLLKKDNKSICWFSKECGKEFFGIEPNGDIYPCDLLFGSEYLYGNIFKDPFDKIANSPKRNKFNKRSDHIKKECAGCNYLEICNGGCPGHAYGCNIDPMKKDPFCQIHKSTFDQMKKLLVEDKIINEKSDLL